DRESRVITERPSRVHVKATGSWQARAEVRERRGAEETIDAADDPYRHDEPCVAQLGDDRTRRSQDPGAERPAHDDGDAETNSENPEELTAAKPAQTRSRMLQQVSPASAFASSEASTAMTL